MLEINHHPADNAKATTVLFVHGAWHGAWAWDQWLPLFNAAGYNVTTFSLRGHGSSGGSARWATLGQYLTDVQAAAATIDGDFVIVGHSMGGLLTQRFIASNPAAGAVLLASIPPRGPWRATLAIAFSHPGAFLKADLTLNLTPIVGTPDLVRHVLFSAETPQSVVDDVAAKVGTESFIGYLAMFLGARPSKVPDMPMLVVGAGKDALFGRADVEATVAAYGADHLNYPSAGHNIMVDTGHETVAADVLSWLDRNF